MKSEQFSVDARLSVTLNWKSIVAAVVFRLSTGETKETTGGVLST